jgi:hypothetical protein
VAVISLEPPLPAASSNLPEMPQKRNASSVIISVWSCIKWGLHCRFCRQKRGELLPRHFTLTGEPAVYFLLRYPYPCGFRPLAGTLLCDARTFLCENRSDNPPPVLLSFECKIERFFYILSKEHICKQINNISCK